MPIKGDCLPIEMFHHMVDFSKIENIVIGKNGDKDLTFNEFYAPMRSNHPCKTPKEFYESVILESMQSDEEWLNGSFRKKFLKNKDFMERYNLFKKAKEIIETHYL